MRTTTIKVIFKMLKDTKVNLSLMNFMDKALLLVG